MKKLFIHIPKTAGMSVLSLIWNNRKYIYKGHMDMCRVNIRHVPNYTDMFSFCIVRDPYERIVSAYNFLKQTKMDKFVRPLHALKETFAKYTTIADCIEDLETLQHTNMMFVPQHTFVCDEDGNILVNSVIKIEHISELVQIDPIFAHMPHRNKSKRGDVVLTDDMKKSIYRVYAKDFEIFQYSS